MMMPALDATDAVADAEGMIAIKSTGYKTSLSRQHGLKLASTSLGVLAETSLRPNLSQGGG